MDNNIRAWLKWRNKPTLKDEKKLANERRLMDEYYKANPPVHLGARAKYLRGQA